MARKTPRARCKESPVASPISRSSTSRSAADSGIDLIRAIGEKFPKVAMVVLSMHDERVYAERSIRAGARGYIMKRKSTRKVVDAIHEVLQGNIYLSKELTELFAQKFISGSADASPIQPTERPRAGGLSLYRQGLRDSRDRRNT